MAASLTFKDMFEKSACGVGIVKNKDAVKEGWTYDTIQSSLGLDLIAQEIWTRYSLAIFVQSIFYILG